MPIPIAVLAALPWKRIASAAVGAIVVGILVLPWILWTGAKKDRAVADAKLVVVERELADARNETLDAIANREKIESALDAIAEANERIASETANLATIAERAGIRARELADARDALAKLRLADAELRDRVENLTVCETRGLVLRSIAEGP